MIGTGSSGYGGREGPPSATCKLRTRKADGVIQSESKGLRMGEAG